MSIYYKCPKCGSTDDIHISVPCWVSLLQEEDEDLFETDLIYGDHEWDNDSLARCINCWWAGTVYDLQEHAQ